MKQPKVMGRQKVRGRIDFTTTLFPLHQKILHHWREATGLSLAAILRLLVEEHSDCRIVPAGFGWRLQRPKFREVEMDHG